MPRLRTAVLAVAVLAGAARPARADGFLTPFYGYNFGGDSSAACQTLFSCEDRRANFGVSLGVMGTVVGFEEDLAFAKDFFGQTPNADNSVFTAMSNLLLGAGKARVAPYFLIGAGLIRTHTSLNPTQFNGEGNSIGFDVGGGINGYFSKHVGVRGDLRYLKTLQDVPLIGSITGNFFENQSLSFWRASIGLALKF